MKTYIGIDPGSKGFITVMAEEGTSFFSIADHTPLEVANFLRAHKENATCIMEEVHALSKSAAKSTFSFGKIFGMLQGIIMANEIPYSLVPPKKWQAEIWCNSDKVKCGSKVDTKKTSFNAAHRLFPNVDLRRTTACKTEDDNKCDSLLICEYARRKNL